MKKFFTCIAMLAAMVSASAQDTTTPNRVLLNRNGMPKAFAVDRVDSISFANVEGEVKAQLNFREVKLGTEVDTLWVDVAKTADCYTYCIDVLPTNTIKDYDDETIARYFEMYPNTTFSDNYNNATLTGFATKLLNNTSYTIFTLGYDKYGVACETSRVEFTTPKKQTVGTPSVTYTIDETTPTSFTLTVTPNEDCAEFYWCQFDKGGAQAQFEQWGPMFNFPNIESMVKMFSYFSYSETSSNTWKDLAPNTEYEVLVVPVDVEGTFGEMVTIPVTTKAIGGSGEAVATITIDNATVSGDECQQYITFTPNDQTAVYHLDLCSKEKFDAEYTDDSITEKLSSDKSPYGEYDTTWDNYFTTTLYWNLAPSTTYYVFALAKNLDGEYGPLTKVEFTTPAGSGVSPMAVKSTPTRARINKQPKKNPSFGKPIMKSRGVTLSE